MQVLNIVDHLFKTCGNGVTALTGIAPVERIKDHCLGVLGFEIALHHGQLIQVCKQC